MAWIHCYGVVLMAMLVTIVLTAPPVCIKNEHACLRNSECCGGCCSKEKCVDYSDSCNVATNPCAVYQCPPNKVCYLNPVQCVSSNCPPLPACKDQDYDDYS
uniref:Uncharacterized protein n=2 Tax=Timema TaxID=61471 RepID=A0A7R9IRA6_9NEOP|nr:unnamed protein product [Timema bartmani]CAD7463138.1 unnamed protein product [Timema tahoe]